MTQDALNSIYGLNRRRMAMAEDLIGRCSQLCEQVLASQGDRPDVAIVQLQHDCSDWTFSASERYEVAPVKAVSDPDAFYEECFEEERT
jgi:hypothetical protein